MRIPEDVGAAQLEMEMPCDGGVCFVPAVGKRPKIGLPNVPMRSLRVIGSPREAAGFRTSRSWNR